MARIKLAILRSTKAKDGSYKIRIAIGHKSETHYIVTRFSVPSLANFRNGTIIGTPTAHHDNLKLRQILTDYEDKLDRIPNLSELSPVELRDTLKRMQSPSPTATIMQMYDKIIREKTTDKRNTSFIDYSRQRLAEYLTDIALINITPATIDGFFRHLHSSGYANTTINSIMQQFRSVINKSIRDGYVKYDTHPFAYYHHLPNQYRDTDITVEELRRVVHLQTKSKMIRVGRDALLLSYYLGGINLIDLLKVDFSKANGILDYIRTKTANTTATRVQLSIHPKAQEIINRYIKDDGHVHFTKTNNFDSVSHYIYEAIKSLCNHLQFHKSDTLSYYTARKSFVQHGFDLGISLDVIEYCVGHSSSHRRMIYNYMRVMRRHGDDAISRIIAHLHEEDAPIEPQTALNQKQCPIAEEQQGTGD